MIITDQILQISHQELIRAGGSDISVQIPAHLGGGYMASLELDHNIHCLVSLVHVARSTLVLIILPVHALETY